MRIIHVMGMESSRYGGLEQYNVELSKILTANNHSVYFVYESEPTVEKYKRDLAQAGGVIKIINSRKSYFLFSLKFIALILQVKPHLVHAHFMNAKFFALPIALFLGVPSIFQTIHSGIRINQFSFKTKFLNRFFLNSRIRSLAVSESVRRQFTEACQITHQRFKTHYLGVHENKVAYEEVQDLYPFMKGLKIIFCIANFNEIKGLDVLVEAVAYLKSKNQFSNCLVIIAGQPQGEIDNLSTLCENLDVKNDIMMLGVRNDTSQLLRMSDIYCQPSRSEGIPLAIMEAMMVGLPIIGSNVGGIGEAVTNLKNGFLFESESSLQLADALKSMIYNDELRVKFGEESLKMSAQFNIKDSVKTLVSLYEESY
jgi:glycosyltransferase involved in cell wall biosynthesis